MAYVTPTARANGYVVPASVWNQDVVDNTIAIKAQVDAISAGGKYACDGRLSLTTGVPVTTADVTAAGTLYWVPYRGNQLALYSGSAWVMFSQAQLSIAVPAVANQVYDVFIDYNGGTPALSLTAWTNDTTRATALTTQDGVYVLTGTTTKRYVGTVRTVTASQLNDSVLLRHVWNYYHRVPRSLLRTDTTASWTYSVATWRQANAAAANQVDVVIGVAESILWLTATSAGLNDTGGMNINVGIGEDSTTAPLSSAAVGHALISGANFQLTLTATLQKAPAAGRHFYAWLEAAQAVGTTTWRGASTSTAGAVTSSGTGLNGWIDA